MVGDGEKLIKLGLGYLFFNLIFLAYSWLTVHPDGRLRVVVCDVGQGDAILVVTPGGKQVLIDAGPDLSVLECLGRWMPFWDREVEALVFTHQHSDHTTGFIEIVKRYENQEIFINQNERKYINSILTNQLLTQRGEKSSPRLTILEKGDRILIDGVEFAVLWPPPRYHSNDLNDTSLVLRLKYKDFSLLLAGDATAKVWRRLQLLGDLPPPTQILKVPHHGARNCCTKAFVAALRPEMALISVGIANRFSHPHPAALKLLEAAGVRIRRTDLEGDLVVIAGQAGTGV
jgi:competence protein ComEC